MKRCDDLEQIVLTSEGKVKADIDLQRLSAID
jgi:hypothetical protein